MTSEENYTGHPVSPVLTKFDNLFLGCIFFGDIPMKITPFGHSQLWEKGKKEQKGPSDALLSMMQVGRTERDWYEQGDAGLIPTSPQGFITQGRGCRSVRVVLLLITGHPHPLCQSLHFHGHWQQI